MNISFNQLNHSKPIRLVVILLILTSLLAPHATVSWAQAALKPMIFMPLVQATSHEPPFLARHVIVFIGDGMGPEQVKAAGMYLYGMPGTLSFESFPIKSQMTTYSADSAITDSAAAATAMATGQKVNNGVISQAIPGDGRVPPGNNLYTLLEYAKDHQMSTGLVTTSYMTDATPAAFGAHTSNRTNYAEIASDYFTQSQPNVLYGGGGNGMSSVSAQAAGYQVILDQPGLSVVGPGWPVYVSGQFGEGPMRYEVDGTGNQPHLSELTRSALDLLNQDPDGFFTMIEGGNIDHAGHINDLNKLLGEMQEFSKSVQVAIDWSKSHPNTLILVLADHETGGLKVIQNNGQGNVPDVTWSTFGHTATNVPVFLYSDQPVTVLPAVIDNTQIPQILTGRKLNP